MTNITLIKRHGNIVAFECKGHSGYAKNGEDIVCAAISAIVQTVEIGVIEVLNISAKVNKNENAGIMILQLPENISSSQLEKAQILFLTMKLALENLLGAYSKFFKMEERDETH
ncbi:MAG: ribosomal-processing cysteine protease Prp [Clostridia bacterium]